MKRLVFRNALRKLLTKIVLPAALLCSIVPAVQAAPLKIGYSDWPGWTALQIGIEKGWFKQAGLDVDFEWMDYSASMDAFSAGKLDAVTMTNGDALVTGSGGAKSVMVLITDFSNGNDMIVAKPGIHSLKDLKGKKVAVEIGLVEHLLLLNGLKKAGMSESDVELVNAKTNDMPQVFASPDIAAVGAWQPVIGEALKAVPGSKPVYTSADEPGLIYDVVAVNPSSVESRRADWVKFVGVWDKIVAYIQDPKTRADAAKIMAAKPGVPAADYEKLMDGTHFLTRAESQKIYVHGDGFKTLEGSSKIVDQFNVANKVYDQPSDIASYMDPSFTMGK